MKKNRVIFFIVLSLLFAISILSIYRFHYNNKDNKIVENEKSNEENEEILLEDEEAVEKYRLLLTNSNSKYLIMSDGWVFNSNEVLVTILDDNMLELFDRIASGDGFQNDPKEGLTLYDIENEVYYKIDVDSNDSNEIVKYFDDDSLDEFVEEYHRIVNKENCKCVNDNHEIPSSLDENLYVFEKTNVVGILKDPIHSDGSVYYYKSCGYIPYALENYNIIFTYPKLTINSSDANLVNQNIRNQIDNLIESYHNNEGQDWGCVSYEINGKTILTTHFIYYSYDIYKVRDYLTIIVTKHAKTSCATGSSDFVISYMIDSSGKLASKDEIISLYGFDEESLENSYMNNIHMDKFIFNGAFMDRNGNLVINVNTDGAAKPTGNYYLKDGVWDNYNELYK